MQRRDRRGNMLAMVAATALLLVAMLMFGLTFLNVMRGNLEQKTAAEAAALAAAADIGRIVVSTPECGYVALCDIPPMPNGQETLAGDNYFCQVRSVNELIGTARLNYIIGCLLSDKMMQDTALQDRDNAMEAKKLLDDEIKKTLVANGKSKDVFGNDVATYDDAYAMYIKNLAKTSEYVPPSLALSFGSLEGGIGTQVSVPNPNTKANVSSSQKLSGSYLSETNIPYNNQDFVFCSTGRTVALADPKKFTLNVPGLPFGYQMPAIVKVDADQKFYDQGKSYVQHFTACASAGADIQHPVGGALAICFPDGPVAELPCPEQLLKWKPMDKKCDVLAACGGDFPVDSPLAYMDDPVWLSSKSAPKWGKKDPTAADVVALGIYDWIRAGGSQVNIDSVIAFLGPSATFDVAPSPTVLWRAPDPMTLAPVSIGNIPTGMMHIYTFKNDGSILYRSKTTKPFPYSVAGENQLYAELDGDLDSKDTPDWKYKEISMNVPEKGKFPPSFKVKTIDFEGTKKFDFYGRDFVRQRGKAQGGRHDGASMDTNYVSRHLPVTSRVLASAIEKQEAKDRKREQLICTRSANYLDETFWRPTRSFDNYETGGKAPPKGKPVGGGGAGVPPTVSVQDDFGTTTVPDPPYNKYSSGPAGGAPRPTYTQNGLAVEFRFRRQIKVGELSVLLGDVDIGYVGEMD